MEGISADEVMDDSVHPLAIPGDNSLGVYLPTPTPCIRPSPLDNSGFDSSPFIFPAPLETSLYSFPCPAFEPYQGQPFTINSQFDGPAFATAGSGSGLGSSSSANHLFSPGAIGLDFRQIPPQSSRSTTNWPVVAPRSQTSTSTQSSLAGAKPTTSSPNLFAPGFSSTWQPTAQTYSDFPFPSAGSPDPSNLHASTPSAFNEQEQVVLDAPPDQNFSDFLITLSNPLGAPTPGSQVLLPTFATPNLSADRGPTDQFGFQLDQPPDNHQALLPTSTLSNPPDMPTHKRGSSGPSNSDDNVTSRGTKRQRATPSDSSRPNRRPKQPADGATKTEEGRQEDIDLAGVDVFGNKQQSDIPVINLEDIEEIPEELLQPKVDNRVKLATFQCVICMDDCTALTLTFCGHLFCSECLHSSLHIDANKKICPICRQKVDVPPASGRYSAKAKGYYPLELKFTTKKQRGKRVVQ